MGFGLSCYEVVTSILAVSFAIESVCEVFEPMSSDMKLEFA
jgi:hypothetical protein